MPKLTRLPILFLAGEQDEVIPAVHMKELYTSAQNASEIRGFIISWDLLTVVWKSWPYGMHNTTCIQTGYFENIGEFVKRNVYCTPRRRGRTLRDAEKDYVAFVQAKY